VTIDGRRRKITKREAIVTQMVDQSASADLRATKMLIDMMKDVEEKAADAAPPPEPRRLAAADKEVVQLFVARLRRQILQEIEEEKPAEPPGWPSLAGDQQILILGLHYRSWPASCRPSTPSNARNKLWSAPLPKEIFVCLGGCTL
jgi:hypothetical protein